MSSPEGKVKTETTCKKAERYAFPDCVRRLKCYYGVISAKEANGIMDCHEIGCFLFRSTSVKDNAARGLMMSVKVAEMSFHHYEIEFCDNRYILIQELTNTEGVKTVIESKYFTSLHMMIDHFKRHRLGCKVRLTDGLDRPYWKLFPWQYEYEEKLGTGRLFTYYKGKVYNDKARDPKDIFVRAVEIFKYNILTEARDEVMTEARAMIRMNNIHVLKFHGLFSRPLKTFVEFSAGGSLDKILAKCGKEMEDNEKLLLLVDAAQGLAYLHQNSCVHRTLCIKNCFISADGLLKIGGFSFAKKMKRTSQLESFRNVPLFLTAPECIHHDVPTNYKTDVWSFGVLVYEVFNSGSKIFAGDDEATIVQQIEGGKMPSPEKVTKLVKVHTLLAAIWMLKPEDRPKMWKVEEMLVDALGKLKEEDLKKMQINKIKGVTRTELVTPIVDEEEASTTEEVSADNSMKSVALSPAKKRVRKIRRTFQLPSKRPTHHRKPDTRSRTVSKEGR